MRFVINYKNFLFRFDLRKIQINTKKKIIILNILHFLLNLKNKVEIY
jgi:hypothetical protein